jgi:hypothetical protein
MTLGPHLVGLFALSFGIALLMALAGVEKSVLEWKRRLRTCPSCGRDPRSGCTCR